MENTSSLVVTFAAARFQGPRFYPGQGRNLDRDFCSMYTSVPPLGPQHGVPESVPILETHLKSDKVKDRPNGCRYVGRNEKTNDIQWQMKSEWKNTEMWKAKGKAMDTNMGGSPGYQSQPNSLETHL